MNSHHYIYVPTSHHLLSTQYYTWIICTPLERNIFFNRNSQSFLTLKGLTPIICLFSSMSLFFHCLIDHSYLHKYTVIFPSIPPSFDYIFFASLCSKIEKNVTPSASQIPQKIVRTKGTWPYTEQQNSSIV